VPLLYSDTRVDEATLRTIYQEHRETVAQTLAALENPPARVTDPVRLERARELGRHALRWLPEEPGPSGLIDSVNASYVVMLVMIDLMKHSLDVPLAPRGRR
jgi:hypothetical protein